MPELPEVEHYRRVAEVVGRGRTIERVACAHDEIVIAGTTAATVQRALKGRAVTGTGRHGKHMWLELDARPWVTLHFGMTGMLLSPSEIPLALASGIRRGPKWPPRFTKLLLTFDDGGELAFTNARRLGRVRLRDDPRTEPPISRLGFDPHLEMPSPALFVKLVKRRAIPIKALLLDQSFAAGVGNWIADEALYQAHIDPRRRAGDLSEAEIRALRSSLRRIVGKAVAVDARSADYPRSWLFHQRWGKKADARLRGQSVEHVEIAGRTTAWVPARQR
jgi:formamidopyrimidine-DNA glycosylase